MHQQRDGRLVVAPGVSVAPAALQWQATGSSGPGGQHVNTTMSAVILHLPLAALVGLDGSARARLRRLAGSRLNLQDELVLRHDGHRSQGRNRAAVLERLQDLVHQALVVPKQRRQTRPTRASVQRRLQGKRQTAQRKERRRSPGEEGI
ncbi:MAG: aminoacyl-tRNA hydrolase [Planctomycetota bacterium]|nr:MAG: aminoacyl-tRNA hydrolase [Planctomycetota bacterium]